MRGLTAEEREFLEYTMIYGGHRQQHPSGPRSGRLTISDEILTDLLIERGLIRVVDCVDPCPLSHPETTPLGLLVYELDTHVRMAA